MEKRLKEYFKFLDYQLSESVSDVQRKNLRKDLLIQIGFFQHERLIHLLVMLAVAILAVMTVFCSLFYQNVGLYMIFILLVGLFIPYLRYYYILENGVAKLYGYYDRVKE